MQSVFKKGQFLLCLLSIGTLSSAQRADSLMAKKIVDDVLVNGTVYDNLRKLCKDIGPRLSGSANYTKAVSATAQMLKDAGADTVYLQECMIPNWLPGEPPKGNLSFKNGKTADLHLIPLGNSVGTGKNGVSGSVIEIKDMDELAERAAEIKGKIVFLNHRMDPTYINTFRAYGEGSRYRTRGPSLAARYGAIAVMVRSLAINLNDVPHTGVTYYNDSFPKVPAVAISTNDAELLSAQLKEGNVSRAWFFTGCINRPKVKGYSVIGELKGSEFPGEIITVGGHLDSWHVGEGANDDGSGVTQSIEVIRVLKALGIQPKRTIRAVMFADEENGGGGSDAYLDNARKNNEKHIFALESDAGGFSPRGFGISGTESSYNKILGWKDLFFPYGVYLFKAGGGGADVGPLREIGATVAGLEPDSQRYFDIHHAATDVFENVSERELRLGAANMALLIYLVSEYGL